MNTDKDQALRDQQMIKAQNTQPGPAGTETERGIYAASACNPPGGFVDSRRSNIRTLKRHKCRVPWRSARNFLSSPAIAAPETERGHSCPQQRPDAAPFQKFPTSLCHPTLLRTGMSALRFGNGFTLIEMLVVIAIIGVLSALLLNLLPRAANMKVRTRVNAELHELVTVVEGYKEKRGHYPPDNPGKPAESSLYYELVGTSLNSGSSVYTTLTGDSSIPAADVTMAFNAPGFINANGTADDAKNFHPVLKANQQVRDMPVNGKTVKLLGVATKGPNGDFCVWNYNSSNPVHNPNSFDLWVDVLLSGKTNTFGNWKKD